jgi:ABC-2 type transport system ATP-binding protein
MSIIQFKNVSKYFEDGLIPKKVQVLEDVNFTIEQGNTYAFLGPNGAGKTTTIKLMLNFLQPSSGKITIFDTTPQNSKVRENIGYVSDHPYFYEYLSAREYLKFCADLYNLPNAQINEKINSMLELVGLSESSEMKLRIFSRGMGQRLSFAQALLHNPDLIILDEPLNGLDPFGRKDLKNLILDLKSQGKTLFFSSHILEDSEILADYVIFIDKGKIIHQDKLSEIKNKFVQSFSIQFAGEAQKLERFSQSFPVDSFQKMGGNLLLEKIASNQLDDCINKSKEAGLNIVNIEKSETKLEDIFVSLIAKGKNENH